MRILITGGNGQLGRAFARRIDGHLVEARDLPDIDICDLGLCGIVAELRPDLILNTAALTDVDGCERDPDAAFAVNALGARNVALAAARIGADLVHFSTDYVFDGRKGEAYWEFDVPTPINVYGASKLAGEQMVQAVWARTFIVRTAWLYGLGGRSFVARILQLAGEKPALEIVDTEYGSPTFCDDLADATFALATTGAYGLYHLGGEGQCSRFEFARAILDAAGRADYPLSRTAHYPRVARPPTYAPLRNFAAAQLGIRLPPWREGLARFFERGGGDLR